MRSLISLIAAAALACAGTAEHVDIAWKVLPRRVVADNFGSRVAKLYYAVVAVVGNNSGYDLQISSILFQLPEATGVTAPVPVDPYRIVRGSLEREHMMGLRSTGINVVKGLGPVLAGGGTLFGGSTYAHVVDIFSNPLEKGLELVFPDKTVPQMAALDSLAMRDNMLIANNTQEVLLTFVSRDLLVTQANRKQLQRGIRGEFDVQAVMRALGNLVLTGKSMTYVDRVTVTVRPK